MFSENHIPLYLKLYWKLRDDILDLEMVSGERMPTVAQLHEQYGVSQGTVRKALDLLENGPTTTVMDRSLRIVYRFSF